MLFSPNTSKQSFPAFASTAGSDISVEAEVLPLSSINKMRVLRVFSVSSSKTVTESDAVLL